MYFDIKNIIKSGKNGNVLPKYLFTKNNINNV